VAQERQLLSNALQNFGRRVLREADSVASSQGAFTNIREGFDSAWVDERAGAWLATYFHHDLVTIFDKSDRPIYSRLGRVAAEPGAKENRLPEVADILDTIRGRSGRTSRAIQLSDRPAGDRRCRDAAKAMRSILRSAGTRSSTGIAQPR